MKQKQKTKQTQYQAQKIEEKIDEAYALDVEIKIKTALFKKKQAELKKFAQKTGLKKLSGNYGQVEFIDGFKNSIDSFKLFSLMQDLGIEDNFFNLVKVKLTDAKKRVGDMYLDEITDSDFVEYAKMKFKKKDKDIE